MLLLDEFWDREDVQQLEDTHIFVFGDNLLGWGKGGQAVIRGLPNAYGVPTKKSPDMFESSFFSDDEYQDNCRAIRRAVAKIPKDGRPWVTHRDIGKGLAKLDRCAPLTYQYLLRALGIPENREEQVITTLSALRLGNAKV